MFDLNTVMEFDHIIQVDSDGNAYDAQLSQAPVYAPSAEDDPEHDVLLDGEPWKDSKWSLMTGYTGQYGYNGPVMHASEFIGGSMAEFILSNPGLYVAIVVEAPCDYDGLTLCELDTGCDCEAAGWAVAYILDDSESE